MDDFLAPLHERAGITGQVSLSVSPALLHNYASLLSRQAHEARALPTAEAADTVGAGLPLSDTGRACTALARALTAAARGVADRRDAMRDAAQLNGSMYTTSDRGLAARILLIEPLK